MVYAYLGNDIVTIQKQLIGIVSLIKVKTGRNTSVIDSTLSINKEILCSRSKDVNLNMKKFLTVLMGKLK
jgi:hypothetical protein